jgi:hypothetical protein
MPVTLQEEHLGTLTSLASSITLPATYTINIWVKNVNLDGTQQWSNLYLQSSGYRYVLDAHYGRIGAGNWTSNSTPDAARLSLAAGDPLKVADTWHLVTVTYDGSTMEYFANGVSIGTVDPTANATLPTAIDVLNGPAGQNFAAEVKDLRVYEGVATSQQIADSYNNNGEIQGENNNMGQITFTFSGLLYDGFASEGTWRLMQGATEWDSGTLADLALAAGDQLVITADNVPTTNIAGGVPIRLEVSDVFNAGLGDGMFQPLGAGNLLTMVGTGAGGVSSSSTFTFSEANSRILENTNYSADTSGFYVQWYSSGMDNSWGNTGDYSTGQLPQDGSVITWHDAIVAANPPAGGGGGGGAGGDVVRTRVHHDQVRMPSHDEYEALLAGEFATPSLAAAAGATPGSLAVSGLPLEFIGVGFDPAAYGVRGASLGQKMIVNKQKLDEDMLAAELLIQNEEARAMGVEAGIQADLDTQEAKEAAYEVSNDAALAVQTGRIDTLLAGSDVDLDTLVELVAAYELADTDIISSITSLQADVDGNESDGDTDRALIRSEMAANETARDISEAAAIAAQEVLAAQARATIQADVDGNEADGDTDRALIRTEMAANETARDISEAAAIAAQEVLAAQARAVIQADVDGNEADGDTDRALIRTEMAANETARDISEAAAIAAQEVLAAQARAVIQADVDANELYGDDDRALIRSEFAQADTDLDVALSASIAVVAQDLLDYETDHNALFAAEVNSRQVLEGEFDAYVISNDAALAVETGRLDALLAGSDVDLDTLVELVAAYELADTDIISSITSLQADVDGNEADGDTDRALIRSEMAAFESARDISVEAVRSVLQADVDANEADGDTDRALIRSEMAAFESARDISVEAVRSVLQADVDANEADGDTDRALIRSEMAANETARDISEAAAIAAQEVLAAQARAVIQADVDANEAAADAAIADVASDLASYESSNDLDVLNIQSDLGALHDRYQVVFLAPLGQQMAPGAAFDFVGMGLQPMSEVVHLTLNGLVMNPYTEMTWIIDGVSGHITGAMSNIALEEGDVISMFGIKAYDLLSQ